MTPVTRLAMVAFGLAIGSGTAAVLTLEGLDLEVVALAAIVAGLAIGNAIAWGPGRRWLLTVLLGASAAILVGIAAGTPIGPSTVLLASALPPAAVLMRARIADATDASFVPVAAHDAVAAIGAAIVATAFAFDVPGWTLPALAATTLGLATGVAAATRPWRLDDDGARSALAGWGAWASLVWGSVGIAAGMAVPGILTIQDERWGINQQGRATTVVGGLVVGAIVLGIGHWYHGLASAAAERRANSAGVAAAVSGGLLIAAAYSTTLIGIVTVLMGAIAVAVFAIALVDVLGWTGRSSGARLASIGIATASAIIGYATAAVVVDGLGGWTARSIVVLGALPLVACGVWAVRRARGPVSGPMGGYDRPPVSSTTPMAFLEVSGLEAGYDRITVLHGIDLVVQSGDVLAVMGMNGVGKTTLLRTLAGLLPSSRGAIVMGGADLSDFPPAWRTELGVCHIAGSDSAVPELTVDENLAMFAHGSRLTQDEFAVRRADAVAMFPVLEERSGQRAETLSGGERQMLALSKAIIQQPRILLIDEFSLGLAPTVVEHLIPRILAITAGGTPTILVEQNVDTALALATRVVVLDKGRITWQGSAERLAGDAELIADLFLPPVGADLA